MRKCCAVACLWLLTPMVRADDAPTLVIYSRTSGFRHESIPVGVQAISRVAEEAGFRVFATEDQDELVSRLGEAGTKVVLFLSTTGNVLDDEQQAAFQAWYRQGNGFVGIHAAADTEYDWAWYGELVGAYFKNHPAIQEAEISVMDREHPSTKMLPDRWVRTDEWYNYRANPRENVRVLCALNVESYRGSEMGHDHPITWCREYDGGRSWYTGLGHTAESYTERLFLEHVMGGIRWAAGVDEDEDAGATNPTTVHAEPDRPAFRKTPSGMAESVRIGSSDQSSPKAFNLASPEAPVAGPGTRELFLVFKGGDGSLFNVNWLEFVRPGGSLGD